MYNLDYECMKYAQDIVNSIDKSDSKKLKTLENNLKKAIGVLQEDGVYAMFLWLESKDEAIRLKLIKLLNESEIKLYLLSDSKKFDNDFARFCENLMEVAKDIDKLFFMKKILERTLTYALYHAKTGEKDVEEG